MNLDNIKNEVSTKVGKDVQIIVYGMRNKKNTYVGKIKKVYPNLFAIQTSLGEKCFTYADVCTGDVKIKYLS